MIDRFNIFVSRLYASLQAEEGQAMAEYALILALVAIMTIGALTGVAGGLAHKLGSIASTLNGG
jgi:Flp pilus assembly pilin Flp